MCSSLLKKYFSSSSVCCYFSQTIRNDALRRSSTFRNQQQLSNILGTNCERTKKKGVQFTVRSLTFADIPQVMDIRRQIDGIQVESCLHSWVTLDPGCIKIATTDSGEIIGTCSNAKNGDEEDGFCFGGLFYVKPEYQNQGIGVTLWSSCLQHTGSRNAGLNAAPGLLGVFRKEGGFPVYDDSFTTVEYRISSSDFTFSLSDTPPPGINICPFHSSHLPSIFAYDLDLIGFQRSSALKLNLLEPGSRTLVALSNDGACAGFGTVKITCAGAVRVGPLYADKPEVAEVLFRRLFGMEKPAYFVFVTTSSNLYVKKWMDRIGVKAWKMCDRLYNKEKLDGVDLKKVFALLDINFAPF